MHRPAKFSLFIACIFLLGGCTASSPQASKARIVSERGASIPALTAFIREPEPEDEPEEKKDLQVGSRDPLVKRLQERLIELGYLHRDTASEEFDLETEGALKLFQRQIGIEATGTATIATLARIFGDDAPVHETPEPGIDDVPVPQTTAAARQNALTSQEAQAPIAPVSTSAITSRPTGTGSLSGVRIGLDPGHQARGNSDPEPVAPGSTQTKAKVSSGTSGTATGVDEYVVNLQVALKLRDLLLDQGAEVIMTRETNDVNISNSERARLLNDAQVDLAIRLHCDGEDDPSRNGAFILIPAGEHTTAIQAKSREAAEDILAAFTETTGAKDLGLSERSDQTGFNWSTVPVINIEMGHMSNADEDRKLASSEYQDLCAMGILQGISDYFA